MTLRWMHAVPTLLVAYCIVFGETCSGVKLRFKKNGTFKIAQFTDLQYGEIAFPAQDSDSDRMQRVILEEEDDVDLVVLTGDVVSANYLDRVPEGDPLRDLFFQQAYTNATRVIRDKEITYALVLGDKDDQGNLDREQIVTFDKEIGQDLALAEGRMNYQLSVLDAETEEPIAYLWMFDSGNKDCEGADGWGCISPEDVLWFRRRGSHLKCHRLQRPGLMFMHIPPQETLQALTNLPIYGNSNRKGDVCCQYLNTGIFAAAVEDGSVLSIHYGHDHSNDFAVDMDGIWLMYGRRTGHGGHESDKQIVRGARILQLTLESHNDAQAGEMPKVNLETWIRTENGEKLNPMLDEPTCNDGGDEESAHACVASPVCCMPTQKSMN
eukprot:Clim_evm72s207 gene=Clim_evmTU72s207